MLSVHYSQNRHLVKNNLRTLRNSSMLGKMSMSPRILAAVEVLIVAGTAFLTRAVLHRFGTGVGGGAVAVIVTLALATWLLRRRGMDWRDLGWRRPVGLGAAALWAVGLFLVDMLLIPPLMLMLGDAFHLPAQHFGAFADLRGNLAQYLFLLIPISWGSAAFGEELIFRGFLARRLSDALGGSRQAELIAAAGQATLFALAHAYLGPRGMLNAAALGLSSALCYRWNGRNLWPLFIAHGLVDTVGITALYFGVAHS
jgi:uncharacterized protein